jgi:hypothetical protein
MIPLLELQKLPCGLTTVSDFLKTGWLGVLLLLLTMQHPFLKIKCLVVLVVVPMSLPEHRAVLVIKTTISLLVVLRGWVLVPGFLLMLKISVDTSGLWVVTVGSPIMKLLLPDPILLVPWNRPVFTAVEEFYLTLS